MRIVYPNTMKAGCMIVILVLIDNKHNTNNIIIFRHNHTTGTIYEILFSD